MKKEKQKKKKKKNYTEKKISKKITSVQKKKVEKMKLNNPLNLKKGNRSRIIIFLNLNRLHKDSKLEKNWQNMKEIRKKKMQFVLN